MSDPALDHEVTVLIPPDVPAGAQPNGGREVTYAGEVFGTEWSLRLVRKGSTNPANDDAYLAQLVKASSQTLSLIDQQMSLWLETSDIVRYNALATGQDMLLPEPFATVTSKAFAMCEETRGAFDPGLYEAVEKWGFGARDQVDPVASGLAFSQARSAAPLITDLLQDSVLTKREGFALDLNGIAKGYAVDLLCDVIRSHPDTAACCVEIGGEFKGYGTRSDGIPFWVDLAPDGDEHNPSYRAALYGWACATSGEAERYHEYGGTIYSHILAPQTGASVQSDLIAATVFDKECVRADALATAMIVMGAEKALVFAEDRAIPCVLSPRRGNADIISSAMQEWL
ncbi:MAG: FAD:protein FMN transferase [Pseudomonadota bacterium]